MIDLKDGIMAEIVSYSEEDTKKIAKNLASYLKSGDIVILSGDLGSRQNKVY